MTEEIQYKEFNGNAKTQIPALLKAGLQIMNWAHFMDLRNQGKLKGHRKDLADTVVYNTRGDAKVVRDSTDLKNINPNSSIKEYALNLSVRSDSAFEELGNGKNILYLPKGKIKKLHGKKYIKESAKDSELWNFVARNNSRLVEYVENIFPEMRTRFGIKEGMEWYFDSPSNFVKLRAVFAGRLEGRSNANAGYVLGYEDDQFVGISVGDANRKDLENKAIQTPTFEEVLKFSQKYIPKVAQEQFKKDLGKLYSKE